MATDAPPPTPPEDSEGGEEGKEGKDTGTVTAPAGSALPDGPTAAEFSAMQESPEFAELRRTHRSFAFPLTVAFIVWYLLYVLLSNYATGFMGTKLFGNINVALVFGLAQFLTTFLIAWWYSRHAANRLDPQAEAIKTRMEGGS